MKNLNNKLKRIGKKIMKVQISEIFCSIQGEGVFAGVPSVFLRTNGCNLRCCFAGGSICDTAYTSHHPGESEYTDTKEVTEELKKIFKENPNVRHLVITGGEPMIQQRALIEILKDLEENPINLPIITVETNGSISPLEEFYYYVDFWSVSPKLSTSACFDGTDIPKESREHHNKTRINIKSLYDIIMSSRKIQMKFVYSDSSNENEIKDLLKQIYDYGSNTTNSYVFQECFNENLQVMLMPEGQILEQVQRSSKEAVEVCIKNGWRFTDRLHIRIWGDKRKV